MALSNTFPEQTARRQGKILYRYNVAEKQVTDGLTGTTHTQYEYDEVEIDGEITAAKVLAAISATERKQDSRDIATTIANRQTAKDKLKTMRMKGSSIPQLAEALAALMDTLGIEHNG